MYLLPQSAPDGRIIDAIRGRYAHDHGDVPIVGDCSFVSFIREHGGGWQAHSPNNDALFSRTHLIAGITLGADNA
jgi:hypothetical protein